MNSDLASKFLIGFAHVLRHQGFLASADQSISFLSATQALGPKSLADIRRAAQAIFAPPPEHRDIFNELFDQYFTMHGLIKTETINSNDINKFTPRDKHGEFTWHC